MNGLVEKINQWLVTHVPRLDLASRREQRPPDASGSWRRIQEVMWSGMHRYTVALEVFNSGSVVLTIERRGRLSPNEISVFSRLRFWAEDASGNLTYPAEPVVGAGVAGVVCLASIEVLGDDVRLRVDLDTPAVTFIGDLNRWLRWSGTWAAAYTGVARSSFECGGQPLEAEVHLGEDSAHLSIRYPLNGMPSDLSQALRGMHLVDVVSPTNRDRGYFDDSNGGVVVVYRLPAPASEGLVALMPESA